jgi:ESCRT-II complex subunit VPS22
MRRGVGVKALKQRTEQASSFATVAENSRKEKLAHVKQCLETFHTAISEFALKYRDKINKDPEFRQHFHRMCNLIHIDPLASSKGFWASVLGIGDYYYSLSIQIVQVAMQTRKINGGIMPLTELLDILKEKMKSRNLVRVTEEDCIRAVDKLACLGNGFRIVNVISCVD